LDYLEICRKASRALARQGVCERDELISEGCLALSIRKPDTEAVGVTIARRAMISVLRKSERRNRGRVDVDSVHVGNPDGGELRDGDQWDAAVHRGQHLQPVRPVPDVCEAMRVLPDRQYRAIDLMYWRGMTEEAVGVKMGITQQAVHALLEKAKENLRKGVVISHSRAITIVRGNETQRTVLSGGTEAA